MKSSLWIAAILGLCAFADQAARLRAAEPREQTRQYARATYRVFATGMCRCADGACRQISCSAEAGTEAEVSFAKTRLRAELAVKASTLNGQLDQTSVRFTVSAEF